MMSADPERIGEGGAGRDVGGLAVGSDAWVELDKNRRQGNRDGTSSLPTTPTAAAAADAECSLASCQQSAVSSPGDDQSTYMNLRHKCNRKPIQEHCRPKRETARSMCRPLKQWLYCHRDQPYPSRADKLQLASQSKMTVVQVSNWFANARRRLKKTGQPAAAASSSPSGATAVLSWEQRFKLYNRNVVGNQERLSISSDESEEMDDFNSDDDEAVSAGSAKPYSTSSGNFSGEEKDFPAARSSSGDGERAVGLLLPGKFKQGILHRYLSDSYRMSFVRSSTDIGGGGGGGGDVDRVRKMSGSPTSRDSAVSTSCRSTPTRDHQNEESFETVDVYSNEHVQSQGESADYELQSLELSAVHVLVSLAASNRNSQRNS